MKTNYPQANEIAAFHTFPFHLCPTDNKNKTTKILKCIVLHKKCAYTASLPLVVFFGKPSET